MIVLYVSTYKKLKIMDFFLFLDNNANISYFIIYFLFKFYAAFGNIAGDIASGAVQKNQYYFLTSN